MRHETAPLIGDPRIADLVYSTSTEPGPDGLPIAVEHVKGRVGNEEVSFHFPQDVPGERIRGAVRKPRKPWRAFGYTLDVQKVVEGLLPALRERAAKQAKAELRARAAGQTPPASR